MGRQRERAREDQPGRLKTKRRKRRVGCGFQARERQVRFGVMVVVGVGGGERREGREPG